MSTWALEAAGSAGEECYRFTRANGSQVGNYTSASVPRSITVDPSIGDFLATFTPLAITRERVDASNERGGTAIRIRVPIDSDIGALYAGARPYDTVEVQIYRTHRGTGNHARIFYGDIVGASVDGGAVVLSCEPKSHALTRPILRVLYQAPCNHNLYDAFCGVTAASFATSGTVSAIASDAVTLTITEADALDDGWFTAGLLKLGNEYGFITSHVGDQVVLVRRVPGLVVSSAVTLYAGCDRSLATCTTKFSNTENHMGFPFIPTINPFTKGVD